MKNLQQELISIIVPVYNVEKYLDRCVNSIVNQTYTNIEIILVDDGSPDNCGQICDHWAKKDERIQVIHQKNKGLSGARNVGIDVAKGTYISFIDSDDFVQSNFIEKLYEAILTEQAQLSQCSVQYVEKEEQFVWSEETGGKTAGSMEMLAELYGSHHLEYTVVWNKLYERSLFETLRFPEGKIHEDEYVIYKIYDAIEMAVVIPLKGYAYYVDNSSITRRKYSLKRQDIILALENRIMYFKEKNYKELMHLTGERLADVLIYHGYCCRTFLKGQGNDKELYQKFRTLYKGQNKFRKSGMLKRMYLGMYYYVPAFFNAIFVLYQRSKKGGV